MPFISFSYLIALVRTSSTMLNGSEESGHPCLVPYLRGKAFSLSSLSMMLAVGLKWLLYTRKFGVFYYMAIVIMLCSKNNCFRLQ